MARFPPLPLTRKKSCRILYWAMALNIKDPKTDRLARELAEVTGESITVAINVAVKDRLERISGSVPREQRLQELTRIAEEAATLPILNDSGPEKIIGYDDHGLPD